MSTLIEVNTSPILIVRMFVVVLVVEDVLCECFLRIGLSHALVDNDIGGCQNLSTYVGRCKDMLAYCAMGYTQCCEYDVARAT